MTNLYLTVLGVLSRAYENVMPECAGETISSASGNKLDLMNNAVEMTRTVEEIMDREPAVVGYDEMLGSVFDKMIEKSQTAVVVREGSSIMGLITASDLARFIIQGQDLSKANIRDFMTFCSLSGPTPCIQIRLDDSAYNALNLMVIWGVDMVVVYDKNGEFAGTINILQALKGLKQG